jgi:hypothetical protein
MCNYFSGIIHKDGDVYWLKDYKHGNPTQHENIIRAYNLKDDTLQNRDWVRFEITPNNLAQLGKIKRAELSRDMFNFRWDEQGTAPWLEKNPARYIKKCWIAAEESWKTQLLFTDDIIKELKDHGYIHMMLGDSQILRMGDNSVVQQMWDNSVVQRMGDNSVVQEMGANSVVQEMWANSVVQEMGANSVVQEMGDNSVVQQINGTALARKRDCVYTAANMRFANIGKVEAPKLQ